MSLRRRPRAIAIALAALVCAGTPRLAAAAGSDSSNAAAHFKQGVSLYKEGDYGGALVEFRRAQELSPNYHVLYNVGQALYQLQRYAEALAALQSYLDQGGAQIPGPRRAAVEEDVRALKTRVGYVEVTVDVDGAEIRVDDRPVGTTPLAAPVLVSVGHRNIRVLRGDHVVAERPVDVPAGDHVKVAFELAPAAPVAGPPVTGSPAAPAPASSPTPATTGEAPPSAEAPPASSGGVPWVPWAITGVLAVGTGVTGALALESKSTLTNDLNAFPGSPTAINNARSEARSFAIASDALLAGTAVMAGIALYFTLRSSSSSSPTASAITDPRLRVGLGGVALEGGF